MKTANTARRTTTISVGAFDETGADQIDPDHRENDYRGEDVVPAGRGVVPYEERGRVASEGDRHHRADDHDRREVAEPGRDPDQPPVSEALEEVRDQATRGRIADAQLDDVVAEQRCDDAGEQKREPDRRPGDGSGLAEQREDARADHRADAEESGAADAHTTKRLSTTDRVTIERTTRRIDGVS